MKKQNTKRALLMSALSLLLCVSMLIGSTFAWFTDSVTSAGNIIKSGTLDVEMYWAEGKEAPDAANWKDASTEAIFDYDLWEPGFVQARHIKIANKGTLALKYQLQIVANGEVSDLAKVIDVYFADPATVADRAMTDMTRVGTLEEVLAGMPQNAAGTLLAGENAEVTLALKMQETAGNEYQNKAIGTDFSVILMATQFTYEEDSFGSDYDQNATYSVFSVPVVLPEQNATEGVLLETYEETPVSVYVPAEIVDALPDGVTKISLAHTAPEFDAAAKTVTFDAVDIVDQNGNPVELADLQFEGELTITLPVAGKFAEGETVAVYHDGEFICSAVVSGGEISYNVAHLCEIIVEGIASVEKNEEGIYEIGSATELFAFAQSVNGGKSYKGETVVLTADIDLNNTAWTPIGSFNYDRDAQAYANVVAFMGTFDGQGHTISNLKVNNPNAEYGALFGCAEAATIQNVKIHNVDIVAGSHAAPILARGYNYSKTTTVTNCHVTGNISIQIDWAYAGGIVAKATGLKLSNCSVLPTGTGVITAANRNAVGGIVGWTEAVGTCTIENCEAKNLKLTGWANIGAINGYIQAGCKIDNCSAENIVLTKTRADGHPTIGLVAGGFSYNATQPITITNNAVKNITLNGTHIAAPASANILYGAEFSGNANSNFVLDNNTSENVTNNLVEVVKATTAAELKAALANGGNIVLMNDITVTDSLAMNQSGTLDLNGKTLYMSTTDDSPIGNAANITIKNGTVDISGANFTEHNGIFNFKGGVANTLTFENVNFYGDGFTSYSVFWLAKASTGTNTLNLVNSKFELKNEKYSSGGFIKHPSGVVDCSAINITNSVLDFENVTRLFLYGAYNIKDSEISFVDTTGEANGLRQGQFTIDNSKITISGGDKGISPKFANTVIQNGSVVTINNVKGNDVIFESDFDILVDSSSTFTYTAVSGNGGGEIVVAE